MKVQEVNNIFQFATSELSQDAFISWSVNWFNNRKKPRLTEMSKELLRLFAGIEKVESVDVFKQYKKIDVLLIVNGNVAVIIEDKTFTSAHNSQ